MAWIETLENLLSRLTSIVDQASSVTITDNDVYQHYRDVHGRHATREFAADMEISQRTARRAFAGEPGRRQFLSGNLFRQVKATLLADRQADVLAGIDDDLSSVDVGTVNVFYAGASAGTRTIGEQDLTGSASAAIRRALQRGDQARAVELIEGAVMDVYGAPMLTLRP